MQSERISGIISNQTSIFEVVLEISQMVTAEEQRGISA